MKRIVFLISLFITTALNCQAECKLSSAKVDELYELTSIVWRLAGASEYNECMISNYANAVDRYFTPYKKHPIIAYCKKIRKARAISYDTPLSVVAFLTIENENIKYINGYCAKSIIDIDARWTEAFLDKYIQLLDDFYKASKFHDFFVSQNHIYRQAEQIIDSLIIKHIDIRWFEDFFNTKFPELQVFVSLSNGPSNYSLGKSYYPQVRRGIIMGGIRDDYYKKGKFTHSPLLFNTILHEITHAMEPLALSYFKQSKTASIKAYEKREEIFRETGVGFEGVHVEWLTRLYVIQYLKSHFTKVEVNKQILHEMSVGFIWMHRSHDFMRHFDENRDKYKTIVDFLPQLAAHYNHSILHEYDIIEREWLMKIPYVTDVFPAPDSEIDFNQDSIRIEFTFSRDMNINAEGYRLLMRNPLAASNCNENDFRTFWLNPRKYVCIGSTDALKQIGFYGIELSSDFMQADGGYNMAKDYKVKYK